MPEFASESELEPKKRGSTRIVQAVPLTVTGVDALGRPFEERTSTQVINCHGCRYHSKHYVLKNMWVTLDVPHPEQGRSPRTVRGRVTWIQRPRTVRELFQVGVKLEVPGNIWGISFAPEDWFPFPEGEISTARPLQQEEAERSDHTEETAPTFSAGEGDLHILSDSGSVEPSVALARQVARLVMEAKQQLQTAAREATAQSVAEETRPLLAAIHNQMKEAAEKSVHSAAAAYREQLLKETIERVNEARDSNLQALREKWTNEIERHISGETPHLAEQFAQISRAHHASFEQEVLAHLNQALDKLQRLSAEAGASVESSLATAQQVKNQIAEIAAREGHRWQELVAGHTYQARAQLDELEAAARRLREEIRSATTEVQEGWRHRLDADLAAAGTRWTDTIETSLESAAKLAAERLEHHAQGTSSAFEQNLAARISALRQSLEQTILDAENFSTRLRTALGQEVERASSSISELENTAKRAEGLSARLDTMGETTAEKLQQRFETILVEHSHELNSRFEEAAAGMAERMRPVLESTGEQTVTRLAAQLEEKLLLPLSLANETIEKLRAGSQETEEALRTHEKTVAQVQEQLRAAAEESLRGQEQNLAALTERSMQSAEEALRAHHDRVTQAFERTFQESTTRLEEGQDRLRSHQEHLLEAAEQVRKSAEARVQESEDLMRKHQAHLAQAADQAAQQIADRLQKSMEEFKNQFEEAGRAATNQWLAELDAKVTDASHSTIESLYKSSEWYEKKVQTQMQAAVDKGLDQAAAGLREKAGEISGLFASELDHYSRNFVEHTQNQMEEAAKETVERTRAELSQTVESTTVPFEERIQAASQSELERFARSADDAREQAEVRLEDHVAQVCSRIDAEGQRFLAEFHQSMERQVEQGVAQARQEVESQMAPALDTLRTEREMQESQFRTAATGFSQEAVDGYQQRLETVSSSWLLTTASKLNRQSEELITALTQSAEQRLHETCAQVFAEVGETLRQRLSGLSSKASSASAGSG